MSSNWYVYKLFKNGKRAKAPIGSFEHKGDPSTARHFFESNKKNILDKKFNEKKFEFKILNSNSPNLEPCESEEQKYQKEKNRVLAKLIREKQIKTKRSISGGLVFCKESSWKWQWAVLEVATNNYIEGLSQKFKSYEDAKNWMNNKIELL